MIVFAGELRLLAIDLANDPGVVASGATLSAPVLSVVKKVGETTVAGVVVNTPAAPVIVGTQIRFWTNWTNVPNARYWILAQATLSNGETAKARAFVKVEG